MPLARYLVNRPRYIVHDLLMNKKDAEIIWREDAYNQMASQQLS